MVLLLRGQFTDFRQVWRIGTKDLGRFKSTLAEPIQPVPAVQNVVSSNPIGLFISIFSLSMSGF